MSNPWASSFDEYRQIVLGEKRRWQDDDGDGKWYEKSDVDGKISKREKKAKKHNCASKVKHEEFGVGNPVKGMHDLDENGVVQHYDVFFDHGIEKNVPVSSLEILEGHMHEHVIHEGKKNCGCGQDPCITYGKGKNAHIMSDGTVMPGKTHKEEYDNTKSPDYKKKKKALAKKHGGAKNIKGHPQYEHHGIDIEHLDGTQTQIHDVVKAPKMVAAPKLSNWREDFVWDEALKNPKLELEGDGKKDVKNKVEINPTVATEGYMSKDKEGHTTGGFRISDKEAKKAKERLKKKYKKEEVEQIDEIDGGKLGGLAAATIVGGGLELMRRAKKAAERIKQKRTDAMNKALGEEKKKGLDGKACWKGYRLAGTKKKGGKTVDNCVKEEEKKNLDEVKVKYYSGQDRNPNTGLPKGLKAAPVRTEKEVNKKLDRTTLAQSYEPEGEVVTELNRYEKETGKSSGSMNMPKGRPTKKGGTSSPVMRAVRTKIRKETGKPHGQRKKTKGEKGNRQPGDRRTTPADTIAKRRQSKADAERLMRDTSGT